MMPSKTIALILSILLLVSASLCKDKLQLQIDKVHASVQAKAKAENLKSNGKRLGSEEPVDLKDKYMCVGGVDPSTMSKTEYLEAFRKGSCTPGVFIPGIGGSKLTVHIDCEVLKEKNKDIFDSCGWDSCNPMDFVPSLHQDEGLEKASVPNESYHLWVPDMVGPFSLAHQISVNPFSSNVFETCFSKVFGLEAIKGSNNRYKLVDKEGIKIETMGTSDKVKNPQCAFDAVSNLSPIGLVSLNYEYYDNFNKYFTQMGYVSGLTMQALPYDWRLPYTANGASARFTNIVDDLFGITGKKVSILAHSMGNYVAYYNLLEMSQADKDQKIRAWHAMAAPILGAGETLKDAFGLDTFKWKRFLPVSYKSVLPIIDHTPTLYQLAPRNVYAHVKETPWFKDLMERVKADLNKQTYFPKTETMQVFPNYTKMCFEPYPERPTQHCDIGVRDFSSYGTLVGQKVTPDNLAQLLRDEGPYPEGGDIYEQVQDPRFDQLANPGVQTNMIYSSVLNTIHGYNYEKHPKDLRKNPTPQQIIMVPGDGTVSTLNSVVPGAKWMDDYINKLPGSYPVNMVEICSKVNQQEKMDPSKNIYIGSPCHCQVAPGKKNSGGGKECNHTNFIKDLGVIGFVAQTMMLGETNTQPSGKFKSFSESDYQLYNQNCQMIYGADKSTKATKAQQKQAGSKAVIE